MIDMFMFVTTSSYAFSAADLFSSLIVLIKASFIVIATRATVFILIGLVRSLVDCFFIRANCFDSKGLSLFDLILLFLTSNVIKCG